MQFNNIKIMDDIIFNNTSDEFNFLSNFSIYPIFIDKQSWRSVEHFYQASKFEEPEVREMIRNVSSPFDLIEKGHKHGRILKNWDEIKGEVMEKALIGKFLQYPQLKNKLLNTGLSNRIIYVSVDRFWGEDKDGKGENNLGRLLMKVRTLLREITINNWILPPWIPFKDIAQEDMFWRMGLGESYIMEWAKWYYSLGVIERKNYEEYYPANEEWNDFYSDY